MVFGSNNHENRNHSKANRSGRGYQPGDPFAPLPSATGDPFAAPSRTDPFSIPPSENRFSGASTAPDPFSRPLTADPFLAPPPSHPASRPGRSDRPSNFAFGQPHPGFSAAGRPSAFASTSNQNASDFGLQHTGTAFGTQAGPSSGLADPFAPRGPVNQGRNRNGPAPIATSSGSRDGQVPFGHRTQRPSAGFPHGPNGRRLSSKLMLPRVPQRMFSREAVLDHFKKYPDVYPIEVSLRGSNTARDGKRTAVISFRTPQEATTAMQHIRQDHDNSLQVLYFKEGPMPGTNPQTSMDQDYPEPHYEPRPHQSTAMSNELLFSFVPKELFTEEAIRNLFDNISDRRVVSVSTKARTMHSGAQKRTAIIAFTDVSAAKAALDGLPLFKGEPLQVKYRNRPPHLQKTSNRNSDDNGHTRPQDAAPFGRTTPDDPIARMENSVQEHPQSVAHTMFAGGNQQDLNTKFTPGPPGPRTLGPGPGFQTQNVLAHDMQTMTNTRVSWEQEKAQLQRSIAEKEREVARLRRNGRGKSKKPEVGVNNNKPNHSGEQSRQMSGERLGVQAQSSKRVVREDTNNGSAWRNVGAKLSLADATQFVGTCQTMCPEKEISERILQRDISFFETQGGQPDAAMAVKKYRRSAAISENPQPEEVRPPAVLVRTMEYLKQICDNTERSFVDVHNFVWDRTRSLRQDFTFQGVMDEQCIKVNEESVRFHIMSEHRLTGTDPDKFSSKQNREQLDKCFISLREMYDLRREKGLPTAPNEAEMQAYYILTQMSNAQTCVQLCTGFERKIRNSVPVQFALHIVKSASSSIGNYYAYFACVRAAPYLMSCLLQTQFTRIRCHALSVLNSTHGNASSSDTIAVSDLTSQLGFDGHEDTVEFCSILGLNPAHGLGNAHVEAIQLPSQSFSEANAYKWKRRPSKLVESKSAGLTCSDIIAGSGAQDYDLSKLPCVTSASLRSKKPVSFPGAGSTGPIPVPAQLRSLHDRQEVPEVSLVSTPTTAPKKPSILDRLSGRMPGRLSSDAPFSGRPLSAPREAASVQKETPPVPPLLAERPHLLQPDAGHEAVKNAITPVVPKGERPQGASIFSDGTYCTPHDSSKRKRVRFNLEGVNQSNPTSVQEEAETQLERLKRQRPETTQITPVSGGLQEPSQLQPTANGIIRDTRSEIAHGRDAPAPAQINHQAEAEAKARSEKIQHEQAKAAEELKHKEMFERAIVRRKEELEQARKELERETERAEAFADFERTVSTCVDTAQTLKAQLVRIQKSFEGFSRFDGLPSGRWERCRETNGQLEEIAEDLYRCHGEVHKVKPLTALGEEAKRALLEDLSALDSLGKDVWKLVWKAEATCLHARERIGGSRLDSCN